jgi:hypothetical protein
LNGSHEPRGDESTGVRNVSCPGRRFRLLCAIALAIPLATCDEFSTEALLRVNLQQATAWPDTLGLPEIAVLGVEILDPEGRAIAGVEVDWQVSDSTIVQVSRLSASQAGSRGDSLPAALTAVVTSHGAGSAEIIARVERSEFEPAELRVPLLVDPSWPAQLTVTRVDTVGIAVEHADETRTGALVAEWTSSDPSVLKVTKLEGDPLRATVTAHASGTAEVVVGVDAQRMEPTVFRTPIAVSPLQVVEAAPWPVSINVTNVDVVGVEVRDASGNPLTDVEVVWRSSNETALTVKELDGYRAEVRALGRGVAEVIATAGGLEFQTAEYRRPISILQKWLAVDAGYKHTCALAIDGTAYCWGRNTDGELGAGHYDHRSIPAKVATFLKFQEIGAGGIPYYDNLWEQAHTCARLGGRVLCWGGFHNGQVGDGQGPCVPDNAPHECAQPLPVEVGLTCATCGSAPQAENIAVGGSHSCAGILSDYPGVVTCWGSIDSGNEGRLPSGGGAHVCTLSDVVGTLCMGSNRAGQLGNGTTVDAPQSVNVFDEAMDPLWARPVAGFQHTCAVRSGRGVWCWGSNSRGQLGTTATSGSCGACSVWAVPVEGLGVNVDAVTLGMEHTCALTAGDAYCWGSDSHGQLGNSTVSSSVVPVLVEGGQRFISISAGAQHTCGVTFDGSLYCWGAGDKGQLGSGSTGNAGVPIRVSEPTE